MIVGKSDEKLDFYDELYFVRRDIKDVKIPSYIKTIKSHSFHGCKQLKSVTFSEDSELFSIENDAFSLSSIEYLSIPASVVELKDCWCSKTLQLNTVSVSPENKNFLCIDDKMIVGKNDEKKKFYDDLVFVRRDIETIQIPSFIKEINLFLFMVHEKFNQ